MAGAGQVLLRAHLDQSLLGTLEHLFVDALHNK
jgi:hypothetical protein